MYRGRFQAGEQIALGIITRNTAGVPTLPDACPSLEIYSAAGKVSGYTPAGQVPIMDRQGVTAFFQGQVFLGSMFSAGLHTVVYRWLVGGTMGADSDTFEVVAGGDARGNVLALHWFHRPQADYLIHQLDSGRIRAGKNPRL